MSDFRNKTHLLETFMNGIIRRACQSDRVRRLILAYRQTPSGRSGGRWRRSLPGPAQKGFNFRKPEANGPA